MKKLLFVINTLGRAGAETALLELLRQLDPGQYEVDLYVLLGQGEMSGELPGYVRLRNRHYKNCSVLSRQGKRSLVGQVLWAMVKRGTLLKRLPYLLGNFRAMLKKKRVLTDKLLWRVISDGGEYFDTVYDLAVAFLEGGSAYYVADHVKARKKAVFVHVDYGRAGYTRKLDRDCYLDFDRIFAVSEEVKSAFLEAYPECGPRTLVFHNLLNPDTIRSKAVLPGGFQDDFEGRRILTIGRLTAQKALEVSVDAMRLLKDRGEHVKWYVLGEGDQRSFLEERIRALGLTEDFLLLGAKDNPYPFLAQADIYVHASRFEGKSIAIQEAQILGKPILVSDCSGNREQVKQAEDGLMCPLEAEKICGAVQMLLHDPKLRRRLGQAASQRTFTDRSELEKLFCLLSED